MKIIVQHHRDRVIIKELLRSTQCRDHPFDHHQIVKEQLVVIPKISNDQIGASETRWHSRMCTTYVSSKSMLDTKKCKVLIFSLIFGWLVSTSNIFLSIAELRTIKLMLTVCLWVKRTS